MSKAITFAYPGDLTTNTGGYSYDRHVIAGLRDLGWSVDLLSLGKGFPFPGPDVHRQAENHLSMLPDGATVVVDGLAFGVLDEWAKREAERLKIVALVHHPLALETGLSEAQARDFVCREKASLAHARSVVVTSRMTSRELVSTYAVPDGKIVVALPGTEKGRDVEPENATSHILSVGTLTARKGHDVLLKALKSIEDLSWQATIVGSRKLDPNASEDLANLVTRLGLGARVELAGETEDTRPYFASADLFALASRYEGYGMVFAEALANGVPIVACRAGAIPEVVPPEAGVLVPVDDVEAFAQALRLLLTNREFKASLAKGARAAGRDLPDWQLTSRIIADCLEQVS